AENQICGSKHTISNRHCSLELSVSSECFVLSKFRRNHNRHFWFNYEIGNTKSQDPMCNWIVGMI
ncbi:Hypothetical predicted protein, partial [Mytilus galloprovincialis]